jgi:hypothetical protein
MFTRELKVNSQNGCVFVGYPSQNDVTFCAVMPIREGNIVTVVTAVKSDGKYLQDMENVKKVMYHREREESGMRNVATVTFENDIPADYLAKLNSYQLEDFTVEYHEEAIVEV